MPDFQSAKTRADAVNLAKEYLKNNPTLKGGNLYELPDGTKLRVRKKEGGRLSAEDYNTKNKADIKRAKGEQTYTTDEARKNAAKTRKSAREISSSTLHGHAYGARVTIAEHSPDIASGGIGDDQDSTSDPYFKDFKDSVAQKIRGKYGDKYIVDINEVTGYLRAIPKTYYNQFQKRSQQPGYDIEPDMDIDRVINALPFMVRDDLSMRQTSSPLAPEPEIKIFATPKGNQQTSTPLIFPDSPPTLPTNTAKAPEQPFVPNVYSFAYSENGNEYGNGFSPFTNGGSNGEATNGDKSSNTLFQVGTAALLTGGAIVSELAKTALGLEFNP
tara:strand:+ start:39 stop:1025 length:987 start_codon:yes stop_codon:yes gene_type:complete